MDKIREELERYNMMIDQDGISVEEVRCEHGYYVRFSDIKDAYKSRDEEIKKLRDALEKCNNYANIMLKHSDYDFRQDIANISKQALKDGE